MFFVVVQANSNASTSVLSRTERALIHSMVVKPKPAGQHGNSKAVCWKYFGQLCFSDGRVVEEADCSVSRHS
jgi:hypothetical protein